MDTLHFDVEEGVGRIRLARPARHNPFDAELRTDLSAVLEQARGDPAIRVLLLTGSDGAFCAGGNLHVLKEHAQAGPAYWQRRMATGLRFTDDLLNIGVPVVAAVDGPAIGAGFALALACDIVLVGPRARFAMSHLRLGLVPDMGAMYLLPRIVGLQRAKELTLSMREVGPEEAKALGIAMEVHASEALEERAAAIARSLVHAAPTAVALTKAALNASLDCDRQAAFNLEAASQAAAFAAPEPLAQIEAMLARKPPAYRGFPPA